MPILIIAEHDNQQLKIATRSAINAAEQLSQPIVVLVAGYDCRAVAEQAALCQGVSKVLLADDAAYQHGLAENLAALTAALAVNFQHVLTPATAFGKNFLPRAAALLDVAMISDVIRVLSPDTFVRPVYAGNAIATVRSQDAIKLLTVRTTAFTPVAQQATAADIEAISSQHPVFTGAAWQSTQASVSERPELTAARVIVAGGRGLGNAENFKLLERLADRLGAAIGASRAAVDAGYAPNDWQVGQTGKIVAPELYIAVGISGAIQHLAGMKDSKIIVAINKDPDASIFQVADYGLVGDLFELLPQLIDRLPAAQ